MPLVHIRGYMLTMVRTIDGLVQPRLLFSVSDEHHIKYLAFYGGVGKDHESDFFTALTNGNYDYDTLGTYIGGPGSVKDYSSKQKLEDIPYKEGGKGSITIGSKSELGKNIHWVTLEFDNPAFKVFLKLKKVTEFTSKKEVSGYVISAGGLKKTTPHPERISKELLSFVTA